jgi:hypothetical protein
MASPQLLGPGVVYMPAPGPREMLRDSWRFALTSWAKRYEDVRAAIATCDAALSKLGKKTGDRADAARSELTATRARLTDALDAFASVGAELDGPAALDLIAKITTARAENAAAELAMRSAEEPADVRACRDAIDLASARGRKVDRELAALSQRLAFPKLPPVADIERAQSDTAQLVEFAGRSTQPARAMHLALDQGLAVSPAVAKWLVCFEPASGKAAELCALRWQRYSEERA